MGIRRELALLANPINKNNIRNTHFFIGSLAYSISAIFAELAIVSLVDSMK
jgi:hypothetical protein